MFFCYCVCGWVVLLSRPSELFPVAFARVGGRVIPRLWGVGIHFSVSFCSFPQQRRVVDLGQRHRTHLEGRPNDENHGVAASEDSEPFSLIFLVPLLASCPFTSRRHTSKIHPPPPNALGWPPPHPCPDRHQHALSPQHPAPPLRLANRLGEPTRGSKTLSHHISTISHAEKK